MRSAAYAVLVLLQIAGPAAAEVLALDCADKGSAVLSIWVDLDKSSVTVQEMNRPDRPLHTYVARITQNTIRWRWSDSGETSSASIDRRTGTLFEKLTETGGAAERSGPFQCTKSATAPPPAKF